ncbi:MAG TPA: hypothetical protein VNY52_02345, partial [Solirubrobacteraceae bacterium]|nr:hypothetical protein [Solirubrobacteraceae bacterium]
MFPSYDLVIPQRVERRHPALQVSRESPPNLDRETREGAGAPDGGRPPGERPANPASKAKGPPGNHPANPASKAKGPPGN